MSSEKSTPCDSREDNYFCPYLDIYGGSESSMCRDCCGLGADEDTPDTTEGAMEAADTEENAINKERHRIEAAVGKLNSLKHNLVFSFREDRDYMELKASSKSNPCQSFGVYNYIVLFDDYTKRVAAYEAMRQYAEIVLRAQDLQKPQAYHNAGV